MSLNERFFHPKNLSCDQGSRIFDIAEIIGFMSGQSSIIGILFAILIDSIYFFSGTPEIFQIFEIFYKLSLIFIGLRSSFSWYEVFIVDLKKADNPAHP